jgi:hypothetical protein
VTGRNLEYQEHRLDNPWARAVECHRGCRRMGRRPSQVPTVAGKSISVGIAATILGCETIDGTAPTKIVGFGGDLLAALSKCAGHT